MYLKNLQLSNISFTESDSKNFKYSTMTQMTESKFLKLQKEVEVNRRKLMDASHEKKMAINRLTKEWEQTLAVSQNYYFLSEVVSSTTLYCNAIFCSRN